MRGSVQDWVRNQHALHFYDALKMSPERQLFIVPGATHWLLHEKPVLIADTIANFLRRCVERGCLHRVAAP